MFDFISACINLDPVSIVRAGSYVGIALLIFAESGLLIGIVLPGDSLLFTAGLLSAGGLLSPLPLIVCVVIAAIAGDSVGYWFGTQVGSTFYTRKDSRFFKRDYVTRATNFYTTYGGRAIVLARFVPIIRTLTPMLAGIARMQYRRFLTYNIIGGTLWGVGLTLLGYTLGTLIPDSERYILPLSITIIILSFLPAVTSLLRKHVR